MARTREEKINCPSCGGTIKVTVWDSLNAQIDMDDAKSLMDGTLFDYVCPLCGAGISVDNPMLYNDMLHRVMIYYVEDIDACRNIIEKAASKAGAEDYINRIVTDRAALSEKAAVFAAGYDDRVMELVKLVYLADAAETYPKDEIKKAYFYMEEGEPKIELLGKRCFTATFSEETYKNTALAFKQIIEAADDELIIDSAWAIKKLEAL